ncbi:MAG TPA: hypothetical protein VIV60_31590 [Polyangiaceae bacterium]
MAAREGDPDDTIETWSSEYGELVITHPVTGVIVFTYHGHIGVGAVPVIERAEERVAALGIRPDLFIDLEKMSGYDSDYRAAVSKWGARTYHRHGEVRVLVRSLLVAMGIAVSNLTAANKLKPTTKRAEFLAAIDAAIERHRNNASVQSSGHLPQP